MRIYCGDNVGYSFILAGSKFIISVFYILIYFIFVINTVLFYLVLCYVILSSIQKFLILIKIKIVLIKKELNHLNYFFCFG